MGEEVRPINVKLKPEKCNQSKCIDDKDDNRLECHSCKRKVHYLCTCLPPYQLQLHRYSTQAKVFSSYICINCVEIPDFLQNSNSYYQKRFKEKYDEEVAKSVTLKQTITKLTEKIQSLEDELRKTKNPPLCKKELHILLQKSAQKKRRLNSASLDNDQILAIEDTAETTKKSTSNDEPSASPSNTEMLMKHIDNTVEKRFKGVEEILMKVINEKCSKKSSSYAAVTTEIPTNVSPTSQTEQHEVVPRLRLSKSLAEDVNKKERANNVIIHGKEEQEVEADFCYVQNLTKAVTGKFVTPVSVERIGRLVDTKKRPMRFNEVRDKEILMRNLRNLKDQPGYQGISVRDDYTDTERETIKQYVTEAKQRTATELEHSRFVWKVFGSPRNDTLVIKRMQKRIPNSLE